MKSASVIAFITLAALGVLVVLPMGFVVLQAIFPELGAGSFRQPFGAVISTFSDPATLTLIGSTVVTGIGVALVAACLGIPLGALRAQFRLPLAGLWDLLFLIPFLLPPYIAALSWILALQPGGYTQQLFGFNLGALLFSRTGMILVMGLSAFPIVYFAVSRSMMAAGTRLAEAARVFGASPWRAFVQVTLPLALPAVAASLLLAFTLAIEEYGVPAALGSQAGVSMLTTAIERRLADWPIDPPGAALLSLVLVCLAMTAYLTQRALVAGRDYETTTGKAAASHQAALGLWAVPVMLFFALTALVAVGLPIASMLAASLSDTVSGGVVGRQLVVGQFCGAF